MALLRSSSSLKPSPHGFVAGERVRSTAIPRTRTGRSRRMESAARSSAPRSTPLDHEVCATAADARSKTHPAQPEQRTANHRQHLSGNAGTQSRLRWLPGRASGTSGERGCPQPAARCRRPVARRPRCPRHAAPDAHGFRTAYRVDMIGEGTPAARLRRTTAPCRASSSRRLPSDRSMSSDDRIVGETAFM